MRPRTQAPAETHGLGEGRLSEQLLLLLLSSSCVKPGLQSLHRGIVLSLALLSCSIYHRHTLTAPLHDIDTFPLLVPQHHNIQNPA